MFEEELPELVLLEGNQEHEQHPEHHITHVTKKENEYNQREVDDGMFFSVYARFLDSLFLS